MKRILAISDIHGELELFEKLLIKVQYTPEKDQLILLGDYVDRGSHSMDVLDKVIDLQKEGAIVLKGNHEDMMIKALTTSDERSWQHWVIQNGGDKTLKSYGFKTDEYAILSEFPFQKPIFSSTRLTKHVNFIQTLEPLSQYGPYIFVHAGVVPNQKIKEMDPYQLMWIRDKFHQQYKGDQTVIFGHTRTTHLHKVPNCHDVFFGENNIIGIDGGAVYGGQLNCLVLPSKDMYSVL